MDEAFEHDGTIAHIYFFLYYFTSFFLIHVLATTIALDLSNSTHMASVIVGFLRFNHCFITSYLTTLANVEKTKTNRK